MVRRAFAKVSIAVVLLVAPGPIHAQAPSTRSGPEFGAQIFALRQDSYVGGDWAPGIGLTFRLPLVSVIDGRVSFENARTSRREDAICLADAACPTPQDVSGWTATLAASLGVNLGMGDYVGFAAIGFGRTMDSQPRGMLEYGGPTWVWDVGLRRALRPNLGVEIGYRLLRMSWDNEFRRVAQGVHMTHHRLNVGVSFAPWAEG